MPHHPDRRIDLQAVHNFRDLGGYRTPDGRQTAWGRVFRADGLYRLTEDDIEKLRPLGLRTVIDLRTAEELSDRGTFPIEKYPVEFVHLSVLDRTWDAGEVGEWTGTEADFLRSKYHLMLQEGSQRIGQALRIISAAENCPLVFHCAAGKDRTGLLATLLLSGLGLSDEIVCADYALSELAAVRTRAWIDASAPHFAEQYANIPVMFHAAHPEAIQGILTDLRITHHSIREYCQTLGVHDEHWQLLEEQLLVQV